MAVNYGGLSGGGSSSGINYSGLSAGGSKKPKKKHEDNWLEKAGGAAAGILAGVVTTGARLAYDPVMEVATAGRHDSKIDDIGMAIVDDYKKRYSSWDDFKSDPVAGVLDMLTVAAAAFTFGGSLAARGAGLAAQGGRISAAGRFAGLEVDSALSAIAKSKGVTSPEFVGARAAAEGRAAATLGRKGIIDRTLSGELGRTKLLKDGTVLAPRTGKLVSIDGTVLDTVPLSSAWHRRAMTEAGLSISNKAPSARLVGSEVRAGKLQDRVNARIGDAEVGQVLGAGRAANVKSFGKHGTAEEKAANFARTSGFTPREYADFLQRNLDELAQTKSLPAYMKRRIKDEAAFGAAAIKAAGTAKGLNRKAAQKFAMERVEELRNVAPDATPFSRERALEQAATWSKVAERAGKDDFEAFIGSRTNLAQAMDNADELILGMEQRRDTFLLPQTEAVFRNPTKVMLRVEEAQGRAAKYSTDFIRGDLNKHVREDMADGTFFAKMVNGGRELTEEEMARLLPRSHARPSSGATNVREMRGRYDKKPSSPKSRPSSVPEFSKFSRGYTMQYALDSMSPTGVFKTWNESRAWRAKARVMDSIAKSGIQIDDAAAARILVEGATATQLKEHLRRTGNYAIVGGDSEMRKQVERMLDRLNNEVRVIAGKDAIAVDEVDGIFTKMLDRMQDGAGEWAIPKAYHKALTKDLRRSESFLARLIDAPTAVFRAAVLSLRPAWIVNNFVGQMMLLMYSQGVYHGTREYMMEVGRALKSADVRVPFTTNTVRAGKATRLGEALDDTTGGLTAGAGSLSGEVTRQGAEAEGSKGLGWLIDWPGLKRTRDAVGKPEGSMAAHTGAIIAKALPSGAHGLSQWMGRVNAILTDDIPRRAAFMGEVRPILKQIQKARPELDDADALRIAMQSDEVAGRLVDKVMGDMIDFSRMSQTEREVVRRLVPFYSWLKGMTLRTGRMVRDEPHKALLSYQLGKQYSAGAEDRFGGPVPDYLRGALVLGKDKDGRPRIVTTGGMNIFQTPADVLAMATSPLTKGELKLGGGSPLSAVNPVFKSAGEIAFGRDFFYGGPLYSNPESGKGLFNFNAGAADNPYTPEDESRNLAAAYGARYLSQLGPLALYQRYQKAGPAGAEDTRTLIRSKRDAISGYLGLPKASLNLEQAARLANDNSKYGLVRYDPTIGEIPVAVGGPK